MPGIYKMLDVSGVIIYIGKAKNIRKRVATYFTDSLKDNKTSSMIKLVDSIEFTVTRSELESLILEHNLIKNYKPKYNIIFRDDKSFPFLKIDEKHKFPQLAFYRGTRNNQDSLYGPYPSSSSVRTAINQLQKIFKVRTCDDSYFSNRSRPCLQYQIDRCTAPCVDLISEDDYRKDLSNIKYFLKGKDKKVIKNLINEMDISSANLNYEKAAIIRDQLSKLKDIEAQQIVSLPSGNFDVIALVIKEDKYCISIFTYRRGELIGSRDFINIMPLNFSKEIILKNFLLQFYDNRNPPKELILSDYPSDPLMIQKRLSSLSQKKIILKSNVRGKRLKLLELVINHSIQKLSSKQNKYNEGNISLTLLRKELKIDKYNLSIECFDISHTSGNNTIASCIHFNREGLVKSRYKKFNIEDITPGDDYQALYRAVERRFKNAYDDKDLPDLLVLDGGKGQLNKVYDIIKKMNLLAIKLISISKGKNRNSKFDTVYSVHSGYAKKIDLSRNVLYLIQRLRDEAHRFAIKSHRVKQSRSMISSPLQNIQGLGKVRRKDLLKQFGGLQGIRKASIEDISKVKGFSNLLAERVFKYFMDK